MPLADSKTRTRLSHHAFALTATALLLISSFAPAPADGRDNPDEKISPQARLWREMRPLVAAGDEAGARRLVARDAEAARRLYNELLYEAFAANLYSNPQISEAEPTRLLLASTVREAQSLEAKLSEWLKEPRPGVGFEPAGAPLEQFFYLAALARARDRDADALPDAPSGTPRELIERARVLAERAGVELAVASFTGTLSAYAFGERRLDEVGPLISQAETVWKIWGHEVGLAQAPLVRGYTAYIRESWSEAAEHLGRAAELARPIPAMRAERASALGTRAGALRNAGDREGVLLALTAAVEEQRAVLAGAGDDETRLKHSKTLADFEAQTGGALSALGRHGEAADWYERSDILKRKNYEVERAQMRKQLEGFRAVMEKRAAEAPTEDQRRTIRGVLETGASSLLTVLDGLASQNNDAAGVAAIAAERLELARAGGQPINIASALEASARAELNAGNAAGARAAAAEALKLRESDPRRTRLYQTVQLLGDIALGNEEWKEATARYREVVEVTKPGFLPPIFDTGSQPDEAIRRIQARMNDLDLLTREKSALDSLISISIAEARQGNYRAADELLDEVERRIPRLYAAGAPDAADLLGWMESSDTTQINAVAVAERRRRNKLSTDADEEQRLVIAEFAAKQQHASVLSYRALLLEDQNDLERAARAYEQANLLSTNLVGGAFGPSATYIALARIERERGNYDAAEGPLKTALDDAMRRNDTLTMASLLTFKSALRRDQGRYEEALRLAEDAFKLASKTGTRAQVASLQRTLGRAEGSLGGARLAASERHLREALAVWRELGLRAHAAYTLDSLGQTLEKMGRDDEALAAYREGVEIVESLVSSLSTGASAETFSAGRGNRELYEHLIRLLVKKGLASEALQYLDRSKSKALVDALAGTSVTARDAQTGALLARVREASAALRVAEKNLADELARHSAAVDGTRLALLRSQSADARKKYAAAVNELRRANPSLAALVAVTPPDLEQLRRLLPENTLMLSFYPTDTGTYIFTLTRDRVPDVAISRITRTELSRLITDYRALVAPNDEAVTSTQGAGASSVAQTAQSGGARINVRGLGAVRAVNETVAKFTRDAAKVDALTARLYEVLLAPLKSEIDRADTLVLVPSGDLYYLPIHALGDARPDGSIRYLVETRRFAYLASADLLSVVSTQRDARTSAGAVTYRGEGTRLLALGNPDGTLPGATEEVSALTSIFTRAEVFTGRDATVERVAGRKTGSVPFVHFATHGVINSRDPKESYLLLAGEPGRLSVRDLVEDTHSLSFDGTRLVTLSACNTNVGGFDPSAAYGSLSRAFSQAGAPTVVASLWSVDDEATRDTMKVFYAELASGTPKAEALRRAQLSILRDPQRRHPFFWAPFVVLGEWR